MGDGGQRIPADNRRLRGVPPATRLNGMRAGKYVEVCLRGLGDSIKILEQELDRGTGARIALAALEYQYSRLRRALMLEGADRQYKRRGPSGSKLPRRGQPVRVKSVVSGGLPGLGKRR